MNPIYFLSGLGADDKVIAHLNIPGYKIIHIKWLTPETNESLSNYATRMRQNIDQPDPILIGLSFGGIVSLEIAKQMPVKLVILISSIKSRTELPLWMKLSGKFKLNKLLPLRSNRLTEPFQNRSLGVETEEDRTLARYYRRHVDRKFMEWSINEVLNWKGADVDVPVVHIHGGKDRMFPLKNVKADIVIPTGGHFMIMNRAEEISAKIQEVLGTRD